MKWAEILMVRTQQNQVSTKAALAYSDWLTKQIADNVRRQDGARPTRFERQRVQHAGRELLPS